MRLRHGWGRGESGKDAPRVRSVRKLVTSALGKWQAVGPTCFLTDKN